MCLSGEFESLQESIKNAKITLFIIWMNVRGKTFLIRLGLFYAIEFDPKGIKWKLKICFIIWCQNFTKKFIFTTIEMATKNASLHIYVLRSIYNIVIVCNSVFRKQLFFWQSLETFNSIFYLNYRLANWPSKRSYFCHWINYLDYNFGEKCRNSMNCWYL